MDANTSRVPRITADFIFCTQFTSAGYQEHLAFKYIYIYSSHLLPVFKTSERLAQHSQKTASSPLNINHSWQLCPSGTLNPQGWILRSQNRAPPALGFLPNQHNTQPVSIHIKGKKIWSAAHSFKENYQGNFSLRCKPSYVFSCL